MVGLLRAEGLFQITHPLGSREEENSGSNRWFFKGLFARRDSLVWLYFIICAIEQDIL